MNDGYALHDFWSSFAWDAYDAISIPDDAALPYITYETTSDMFNEPIFTPVSLWTRSSSWEQVTRKADEISDRITRGGSVITYDGGAFWIRKGSPWAQRMIDPADKMIRRIILNVWIEYLN